MKLKRFLILVSLSMIGMHLVAADSTTQSLSSTNQSAFQKWWDGSTSLPVMEDPFHVPFNKKSGLQKGSVIPASGPRQQLADAGVTFSGGFSAFFLGNVSGGLNRGFAYNDMLFFQMLLDLEKLVGWKGGSIVWSFADNAGSNLSQKVGNNFQISTDYGPNTFIFDEFYIKQKLLDGALAIKIGQMSLLNDFLSSPLYSNYVNLAFCGNPLSVSYNIPATPLPVATWGAHVRYNQPDWYAQSGIYQVSNRTGQWGYNGANYTIRGTDGTMVFAEAGWTPTFFKAASSSHAADGKGVLDTEKKQQNPGYPGHYKLGGYVSSWAYQQFSNGKNVPNVYGFYVLADQKIYQNPSSPDQGLTLWSAFTTSPQTQVAQLPYFVSGGAEYKGLIPYRKEDKTIFGVAYGSYSGDLAPQATSQGLRQQSYELLFEGDYQIQVNKWLQIQPDIQYIVNPGATHSINNALVIGAVVNLSF